MKITNRGTVYRNETDPAHRSCTGPSICLLPSGRWLCSFAAAPVKSQTVREALLSSSSDEGKSWSEPIAPFRPCPADGKPGAFRNIYLTLLGAKQVLASLLWVDQSDPGLPFFNETTEGLLDTRVFFSTSDDEGATWSQPRSMNTAPFHVPTPLTGPTLVLPSGEWVCQLELNKPYFDPAPWRHSSVLMFSKDEGRSWPEHALVTDDPELRIFYWDQRPAVLAGGRMLDVFWTFDRKPAVYLNIHARESRDNGRTWSALWDCGIPGQPAPPLPLVDGRLALVYMDRTAAPLLKLRVSSDGGRSWPNETELILYEPDVASQSWDKKSMQDAWAEMGKFSVGLPSTARTKEDDIIVAYYAGAHTDRTGIEWVRVRPDR